MIRLARIPTLGFNGFDFDMPSIPDFGDLTLPPSPPGPMPPAPPPAPPPAAPPEPPPAVPPPPTVTPEEFEFLFPVTAGVLACPAGNGLYNLIDPVSGALAARSATLPPGATVIGAGDPRCVAVAGAPAPAPAAAPAKEEGISTQTLLIGGTVALGVIALLVSMSKPG